MTEEVTNEQIVAEIRSRGDPSGELRLRLVEMNQGYITNMFKSYSDILSYKNDLPGISFLAVSSAADAYDADKGSFLSILSICLKTELVRAVEEQQTYSGVRLPWKIKADIRTYRKAVKDFIKEHERQPTTDEIIGRTGFTLEELQEIKAKEKLLYPDSLFKPVGKDPEGEPIELIKTIPGDMDVEQDCISRTYTEQMTLFLAEILKGLPEKERLIINLRFYDNQTVKATALDTGLPEKEIRRLSNSALRAMRRNARLQHFLDESNLYHLTGVSRFRLTNESQTEHDALQLLYFRNKKEGDL